MKLQYRKPSLKTALGVTKAKRQIKKATGISNVTRVVNAPTNVKRTAKRRVGYESGPMKFLRFFGRLFK
jgi:hypothetical protein